MQSEIAVRSIIKKETQKIRSRVLANPLLSLRKRCNIAQTYIWSKGMFQCGAWHSLSCALYKRIHGAIMYVYRALIGRDRAWVLNDDDVISELNVICPMSLLRARRLCLFPRIAFDPFLVTLSEKLCNINKSWASALWADLKWLTFFPDFEHMKSASFPEWCVYVCDNKALYRRRVMKTCSLKLANVVTQWATSPSIATLSEIHNCDLCAVTFRTKQALAVHKFKSHGAKSIERQYLPGTQCPICLNEFWTRERVINHVRYRSTVCRENLLVRPPELTQQRADDLDELEREIYRKMQSCGNRRHKAVEPCKLSVPFCRLLLILNVLRPTIRWDGGILIDSYRAFLRRPVCCCVLGSLIHPLQSHRRPSLYCQKQTNNIYIYIYIYICISVYTLSYPFVGYTA